MSKFLRLDEIRHEILKRLSPENDGLFVYPFYQHQHGDVMYIGRSHAINGAFVSLDVLTKLSDPISIGEATRFSLDNHGLFVPCRSIYAPYVCPYKLDNSSGHGGIAVEDYDLDIDPRTLQGFLVSVRRLGYQEVRGVKDSNSDILRRSEGRLIPLSPSD